MTVTMQMRAAVNIDRKIDGTIVDPKYLMDITEAETMDQIGEISM